MVGPLRALRFVWWDLAVAGYNRSIWEIIFAGYDLLYKYDLWEEHNSGLSFVAKKKAGLLPTGRHTHIIAP